MNPEENALNGKERIHELIKMIRSESEHLVPALWSEEENKASKDFVAATDQRMQSIFLSILRNLYWYEKIGWKKFIPNKALIELAETENGIKKEKERLEEWLKDQHSDFYLLFKNHVSEEKLAGTCSKYGYDELKQLHVLDIGCGDGRWLRKFMDWGVQPERLTGVDLYDPIIEMAKQRSEPGIQFIQSYPDELPFEDHKFDIILTIGVLMHILDESLRKKIGQELLRILADDGMIITYNLLKYAEMGLEPYPYLAYTMKGLGPEELMSIFPGCQIDFEVLSPNGLAVIRKKG